VDFRQEWLSVIASPIVGLAAAGLTLLRRRRDR
jgi:hypothetical protein